MKASCGPSLGGGFSRGIATAIAFSILGATGCAPAPPPTVTASLASPESQGRNIILVLSDTHRLDHVSGFSPKTDDPTPHVASLIRSGAVFPGAITPVPISAPAYATLMTGRLPTEHGLLNNQQQLSPAHPLLQEKLRNAGYRTAAVVSNPYCSSGHGFARGFDHFWDQVEGRGKEGEIVTSEAIEWLESIADGEAFFLFLAYMDAHTPYISDTLPPSLRMDVNGVRVRDAQPENAHIEQRYPVSLHPGRNVIALSFLDLDGPVSPIDAPSPLHVKGLRLASGRALERTTGVEEVEGAGFERLANRSELVITNPESEAVDDELVFRCFRKYRHERIPAFYEAGVRSFDRSFGRLTGYLEQRGLFEDAIIIFLSDHGEMLGEHDSWGHVGHLWDETLRIPLVIKAPGLPGGVRDPARIGLRDIHDLILSMALGPDDERDGVMQARRHEPFVAATYPPEAPSLQVAVIHEGYKIVVEADGSERAFDLRSDPSEGTQLIMNRRDEPELAALLTIARTELATAAATESLDLDALSQEERDRLRALGYLDGDE